MHHWLRISKHIALIQLVDSYLTTLDIFSDADTKVGLYKSKEKSRIIYISTIPLQWAKSHNLSAMKIAEACVAHLPASYYQDLKIQIVSPGSLQIQLVDSLVAAWLQSIILENTLLLQSSSTLSQFPNPQSLFTAQYAHARCCSLIRFAEQQRLIKHGESIPWLESQELRLNHQAENDLIAELVNMVDDLIFRNVSNSAHWQRKALSLSQAFESFWCNCRIWGEVKTNSLELAQARLGLIMATKSVLRFVLEEKLGISALCEL